MAEAAAALGRLAPGTAGAAAFPLPAAEAVPGMPAMHVRWSPDEFQWDSSALIATPKSLGPGRSVSGEAAAEPEAGAAGAAMASSPAVKAEAQEETTTGTSLPTWPDAPPALLASPRGGRTPACQVCGADVAGLKDYYSRYRICPQHCTMPCIVRNGEHLRFCQQVRVGRDRGLQPQQA